MTYVLSFDREDKLKTTRGDFSGSIICPEHAFFFANF